MKASSAGSTAELGVHLAGAAFIEAGFAFRPQTVFDFGIDALAEWVDRERATGQLLAIQIKAGPSYLREVDGDGLVFRTDRRHVAYWLNHPLPVILCLVDIDSRVVYWQSVLEETVHSTGEGFKVVVPRGQQVSDQQVESLLTYATPVVPSTRYTVFGPEDISHGSAKRYSFKVLLNRTASRAEVATILRQVTNEGARRSYNRSDIAAKRWGDSDASVVWVYAYPSMSDMKANNHYASSLWIADDLDAKDRPGPLEGEEFGDGLVIKWSGYYDLRAKMASGGLLRKEDYLTAVDEIIATLSTAHDNLSRRLEDLGPSIASDRNFVEASAADFAAISEAESAFHTLGLAPIECDDLDLVLSGYVGDLGNVVLFYSAQSFLERSASQRLILARTSLQSAENTRGHLRYERIEAR